MITDHASSSTLLLYGIVRGSATSNFDSVCGRSGVQQQPVDLIRCGPLAVFASPLEDVEALRTPSISAALKHKSIVDAAFAHGTVLPMRFGTHVDTREALGEVLHPQEERYRIQLKRLEGYAEMGVRLTFALSSAAQPAELGADKSMAYRSSRPGTAYLLARQRERSATEQKTHRIVQALRDKLGDLSSDSSFSSDPEVSDGVSVAFLVPRGQTDAFREKTLDVTVPGVSSTEVVGPWAPYSFV